MQIATEEAPCTPLFSVVISTKNAARTLTRCLTSLSTQSFRHFEIIVVDGASSDATVEIAQRHRVRIDELVSEPDTGIYAAWNKAIDRARGEWVYFLGADDVLAAEDVLERVAERVAHLPRKVAIAYGACEIRGSDGSIVRRVGERWSLACRKFSGVMSIPHQGVFHRRCMFGRYGRFDEGFRIAGDYEWLRRLYGKEEFRSMPDLVVAVVEEGGISSRHENRWRLLAEMYEAGARHGNKIPHWSWVFAAVSSVAARAWKSHSASSRKHTGTGHR